MTSSAVVMPVAIFMAPDTRSGFIPSLYACARIFESSDSAWIRRRTAGDSIMIS